MSNEFLHANDDEETYKPYTPDQQRVSDYIQEITNGMIGSGPDPIGFLLASHAYTMEQLKQFKEKTPLLPDAISALKALLDRAERETCTHEDTYRGGTIWTICNECGRKWADDRGGFTPYQDPPEFVEARAVITAALFEQRADDKCGKHRCSEGKYCSCRAWAVSR